MEGHCTSGRPPFLRRQAPAPTCQPSLSLRVVACACSALAPLRSLSLGTRPSTCASDARARRAKPATLGPYTMEGHCMSGRPPFLRRQAPAPTCQPSLSLRVVACACSALARHCALSLWGTRPSTCASDARARRAKPATLGPYTMEGHCTSGRPPFLRRQAPAPTCQPSLSLRVVACACSALARHCALSLWGRGPARALPTRARAAPSRRHSVHTPWKGTARAGGRRSFGARPLLPRASPPSHRAWWLARVARLRHCALSLWGRGPARALPTRARAAPSRRHSVIHHERALHEREAAVPSAPGPCSHVPALPLTARGGLRV